MGDIGTNLIPSICMMHETKCGLGLQEVLKEDVVHFDLKCDNILLEMLPGVREEEFWYPSTDQPEFKVVLADFGDSCDFSLSEQKFTTK